MACRMDAAAAARLLAAMLALALVGPADAYQCAAGRCGIREACQQRARSVIASERSEDGLLSTFVRRLERAQSRIIENPGKALEQAQKNAKLYSLMAKLAAEDAEELGKLKAAEAKEMAKRFVALPGQKAVKQAIETKKLDIEAKKQWIEEKKQAIEAAQAEAAQALEEVQE